MSGMPLKTAISDVYPLPDNDTARVGFGALWDALNEFTEKAELDLASAATTNIGGQLSTKLRITGTTGITSFGTTYRGPILIRFAAALTLTHNATTLILPGAANLTTTAGGTMLVYPKATVSGTADGWIVAFSSDYVNAGAGGVASNTAYGQAALDSNTIGTLNTAIGQNALTASTSSSNNTAVGANALAAATATNNTAVGSSALAATSSGGNNTAVGKSALAANGAGSSQVAVGRDALAATVTGTGSVAIGHAALTAHTASTNNTAVGNNALGAASGAATENTAVGASAGGNISTGSNNSVIGSNASASIGTVSNEITLGNSSIATLRCQVTSITALSDARDKKNIMRLAAGLDFVQRLKPVSYVWNMRDGGKVGIADTGFIAQELKQVQVDTGIDIPGLVYEENPEKLEAAYGKLLPVLVKAIQELSDEVTTLRRQLNL